MFKWFNRRDKKDKVLLVKEQVITRTNGFKQDKFRFRKEIGKNWFTNRVVEEWNKLSKYVVSAERVDIFKKKLDTLMFL